MRLIDADALIPSGVHTIIRRTDTGEQLESVIYAEEIDNAPTIDAEPVRHGKWIYEPKDAIEMMFTKPKCSVCGYESADGLHYCSNCGAKMDLKEVEK